MLLQRGFGFSLEAGALDVAFKSFEVDGIASEDLLSILNHRVRAAVLRRFKSFTWGYGTWALPATEARNNAKP